MKIAVRGGHNYKAVGAEKYLSEVVEDRKVKDAVIKYLKEAKHEVLDVTPGNMSSSEDLRYGTSKANNWGAELFVSVHFNSAINPEGNGTEVLVYSKNDMAKRVVDKIAGLGFYNRGLKIEGSKWHELRETKMSAMIIEVCFVSNKKDSDKYKAIGYDAVGKAIAEGIMNKNINFKPEVTPVKPPTTKKKLWEISIQGEEVKSLQRVINVKCDGYFGNDTLNACPTLRQNGAYSSIILQMQKRLNKLGYSFKCDGYFGPITLKYVKKFQKARKSTIDGVAGKNTWTELYKK